MAPGIPGIPNDVQGPAPDAPFRRSPRCSDTSDEPENLSYAKHSILSDKLLTAYTRHGVESIGSAQAASTACSPSVSTAVRISTICRSNVPRRRAWQAAALQIRTKHEAKFCACGPPSSLRVKISTPATRPMWRKSWPRARVSARLTRKSASTRSERVYNL
jgi:hypothetical protein